MPFYTRFRAGMQKCWSVNNMVKYLTSSEACHWYLPWYTFPHWYFVVCIQEHILPGENILGIPLITLIYHIKIPLISTKVFPFFILIQLFYWVLRKNWMFQLLCLTHFRPMFHLRRSQVVGFYLQNAWKTPVEEWHFPSQNQLPGLSVVGTLVENGLISQMFLLILSSYQ